MSGPLSGLPGLAVSVYLTIAADPPWQFQNRTGKVAPEHKRLRRYRTMSFAEIRPMPIADHDAAPMSHFYLWFPNALLEEGLAVMKSWGFQDKTTILTRRAGEENTGEPSLAASGS